jgi:HK97 family phage major capsid protein
MPAEAANAIPLLFGQFKRGFSIVDLHSILAIRDQVTKKGWVGFYVTKRVGTMCLDSQAIRGIKNSAV